MERVSFVAAHHGALLLFALCCWGCGRLALDRLLRRTSMTGGLSAALCLSLGTAIVMLVVQLVALAGLLRTPWLFAVLAAGWLAAGFGWFRCWRANADRPSSRIDLRLHWTIWLVLLLSLCTVLLPLRPPHMWDELSFHLAHAQQWANSGRFQINEWLRYPWSPLGYQLLYASALVLYDDVMAHVLHAYAGWVTALLLYQIGVRYTNRIVAAVAVVLWLALARESFLNAYVDMAVALYLLSAWAAFTLWRAEPDHRGWLAAGAFLLGSAAATKYQALGFFPYFALVLLLDRRRLRLLAVVLGFGLLPCIYWYGRNLVMTGDPFDPLGGALFGFTDWNLQDMVLQLEDVQSGRGWPSWLLWPALAAPLFPRNWRNAGVRAAMLFAACAAVVWLGTSHLPRYLLPMYPVLSWLSALVVWTGIAAVSTHVAGRLRPAADWKPLTRGRLQGAGGMLLLLVVLLPTTRLLQRDWGLIGATHAQRDAFLDRQMWEYRGVLNFLQRDPTARVYQNGMEAALYYAPQPIWGDHFGPWRYRDFMTLPPRELAGKLRRLGFDLLVVKIWFVSSMLDDPIFRQCFNQRFRDQTFAVYRIEPASVCDHDPAPTLSEKSGPLDPQFTVGPAPAANDTASPLPP